MSRRVYISYTFKERELEQVVSLYGFLQVERCVICFAPVAGWSFYRVLEEAIEGADAFVAVVGAFYDCSSWLNHELHYARALNKFRFDARPRLFGLRIGDWNLPHCSEQIELEWLDDTNRHLLADLPQRA